MTDEHRRAGMAPAELAELRAIGWRWRYLPEGVEANERQRARYPNARLPRSPDEYEALVRSLNGPGVEWLWSVLPRSGPKGWLVVARDHLGYKCWQDTAIGTDRLAVQADGRWYERHLTSLCGGISSYERWVHLEVSKGLKTPTHDDLTTVKRLFLGPDRYAYEVWPPERHYVNVATTHLHLWCPLDRPPLPEFSGGYELL